MANGLLLCTCMSMMLIQASQMGGDTLARSSGDKIRHPTLGGVAEPIRANIFGAMSGETKKRGRRPPKLLRAPKARRLKKAGGLRAHFVPKFLPQFVGKNVHPTFNEGMAMCLG